jgi:hypothetical protein
MKIVGCDLHTRYQQIAMLDEETSVAWSTGAERHEHFMQRCRVGYEWGSKLPGIRAGSNVCFRSWDTSCGSGTRPAFALRRYASRRRTLAMPHSCWNSC